VNEGEERALLTQEFPVSSCSPALTSANFHSLARVARELPVVGGFVVVTEMDLSFST